MNHETDDDPIVAEVRRVREELLARFDNDLGALVEFLKQQQKLSAEETRPPASPASQAQKSSLTPDKKAG